MPARLPTDLNRKKMIHKESHSEMIHREMSHRAMIHGESHREMMMIRVMIDRQREREMPAPPNGFEPEEDDPQGEPQRDDDPRDDPRGEPQRDDDDPRDDRQRDRER